MLGTLIAEAFRLGKWVHWQNIERFYGIPSQAADEKGGTFETINIMQMQSLIASVRKIIISEYQTARCKRYLLKRANVQNYILEEH